MVENNGGIGTNEDFEDGMKQMWVGMKGALGQQAGEADTGIATLREQNGKMVRSSKGKRGVLRSIGLPQARNAHRQRNVRRRIREETHHAGKGERRCIRKRG